MDVQIQNQSSHTIYWFIPLPAAFTRATLEPLRLDPGDTVTVDGDAVTANRAADTLVDTWFTIGALVQVG